MTERVSKHFTLDELLRSDTADRLQINNTVVTDEIVSNLVAVTQNILEPVREHFQIPFSPSSGFRCLELNRAIGSKDTSQHTKGQAVDFRVPGFSTFEVAAFIRDNLEFDQLILEMVQEHKPESGWVHCSYTDNNRNEVLTFRKSGEILEGLHE